MQKWEYLVLKAKPGGWLGKVDGESLEQKLNELGAQGWEVTTAIDINAATGVSVEVNIILKRPKQ